MSSSAEQAVAYVLRRIRSDPRIAYHFAHTESLALLCKAYAETNNIDPETFKRDVESSLPTEAPRCRSGECYVSKSQATS
jgi:hypothetical protein